MQNVFLIANSGKSRNPETIIKFKEKIKPGDTIVFFNRFLRDLKDTFWIDFIRKNEDNILFFASRMIPMPVVEDKTKSLHKNIIINLKNNTKKEKLSYASYGLGVSKDKMYQGGCICCGDENIYKKFNKIFIFINESQYPKYKHSCRSKDIENKFNFIFEKDNFLNLELSVPNNNCSSGFLMILYFLKLYKFQKIYMVGFDHFGNDINHPWFEERRFIDENLDKYCLERI